MVAALIFNAVLVVLAAAGGEPRDVIYLLVLGAPPAILLVLRIQPGPFSVLAGSLGLLYLVWGVAAFLFGGALFVPTGLMLVCAALCRVPAATR